MITLPIKLGATFLLNCAYTVGGSPAPLPASVASTVRDRYGNAVQSLTFAAVSGSGGTYQLSATGAQTDAWPVGNLFCDIAYTDSSGNTSITDTFAIVALPAVTNEGPLPNLDNAAFSGGGSLYSRAVPGAGGTATTTITYGGYVQPLEQTQIFFGGSVAASSSITFGSSAVGNVQSNSVVCLVTGGVANPDLTNPAQAATVVGIAFTAANSGNPLTVMTEGSITESAWTWTPGPIYCGAGGTLTQTPPTSGASIVVAQAVSSTTLEVGVHTPIML